MATRCMADSGEYQATSQRPGANNVPRRPQAPAPLGVQPTNQVTAIYARVTHSANPSDLDSFRLEIEGNCSQ
jgi:hypothetical protein